MLKVHALFDSYGCGQYFFGFYDKKVDYDYVEYEGGTAYIKGAAMDMLEGLRERSKKDWEPPLPPVIIEQDNNDGDEWKDKDNGN